MPVRVEGHEPGDLAPSMGWLLGKKRSVLLFLALLLRAEPKAKCWAEGRSMALPPEPGGARHPWTTAL